MRFFEIYRNPEYLWLLAEGAGMSIALTIAGGLFGFMFAIGLARARIGKPGVLSAASTAFVETFRNTPLIVQLFFIAYGLPGLLGYRLEFWQHAAIGLTLNFSAYFAEILRAGLKGIPDGQIEGAQALGLSKRKIFWKIMFPQAAANMFPSLNSQFIFLFLTTGVISEISVRDLYFAGSYIDGRSFRTFEVFLILTVGYIFIALMFKTLLQIFKGYAFKWKDAK